jgi:hypothetical protein
LKSHFKKRLWSDQRAIAQRFQSNQTIAQIFKAIAGEKSTFKRLQSG